MLPVVDEAPKARLIHNELETAMTQQLDLPAITITHEDLALLSSVVQRAMTDGNFAAASRLANEMHRARIVPAAEAPLNCLVLNMSAQYLDEQTGALTEVVLVTETTRASMGVKSVLSGVGTALVGLSEGQRMGWSDSQGRPNMVRLVKVRRKPQASGFVL